MKKKVWYKENEVKVVWAPMGNLNQLAREKLRQTDRERTERRNEKVRVREVLKSERDMRQAEKE